MTIPIGYAQITLIMHGSAQPNGAWVVYGYDHTLDQDPAEIAGIAIQAWDDWVQPRTSSEVALTACRVKLGPDATGASAEVGAAIAGSLVLASVTPNVTYLWSKHTALGGRRGRGRMYWPGVPETHVSQAGVIDPVQHDLNVIAAAGFLAAHQADGHEMVILHDDPAFTPTVVTSLTPSGLVATQRRRLRR